MSGEFVQNHAEFWANRCGVIAPNNTEPVVPTPRQQCLDSFNNSTTGKIINFLSPASVFIGPKPLHSAGEYAVGIPLKIAGYSILRYQQTTNFLPYLSFK